MSIVAVLSGEEVFFSNIHDTDKRGDALTAHAKFENEFGDHLTFLNVFKAFAKSDRPKTWCHDNFLNNRNLTYALDVRKQLSEICSRLNLEFSTCGSKFDQVCVCSLSVLISQFHQTTIYFRCENVFFLVCL